jgi:hypothetical protein
MIRRRIPLLDQNVTAGRIAVADVIQVESDAVLRLVRNPDGYTSETDGNYTYTIAKDLANGRLEILDEEWEILGVFRSSFSTLVPSLAAGDGDGAARTTIFTVTAVQALIDASIAAAGGLSGGAGLGAAAVQQMIDTALLSLECLDEAAVRALIADAFSNLELEGGVTFQQVTDAINNAVATYSLGAVQPLLDLLAVQPNASIEDVTTVWQAISDQHTEFHSLMGLLAGKNPGSGATIAEVMVGLPRLIEIIAELRFQTLLGEVMTEAGCDTGCVQSLINNQLTPASLEAAVTSLFNVLFLGMEQTVIDDRITLITNGILANATEPWIQEIVDAVAGKTDATTQDIIDRLAGFGSGSGAGGLDTAAVQALIDSSTGALDVQVSGALTLLDDLRLHSDVQDQTIVIALQDKADAATVTALSNTVAAQAAELAQLRREVAALLGSSTPGNTGIPAVAAPMACVVPESTPFLTTGSRIHKDEFTYPAGLIGGKWLSLLESGNTGLSVSFSGNSMDFRSLMVDTVGSVLGGGYNPAYYADSHADYWLEARFKFGKPDMPIPVTERAGLTLGSFGEKYSDAAHLELTRTKAGEWWVRVLDGESELGRVRFDLGTDVLTEQLWLAAKVVDGKHITCYVRRDDADFWVPVGSFKTAADGQMLGVYGWCEPWSVTTLNPNPKFDLGDPSVAKILTAVAVSVDRVNIYTLEPINVDTAVSSRGGTVPAKDDRALPMTHIPGVVPGISMNRLKKLVADGTIPHVLKDRVKLVRPSDVKAVLDEHSG